MNPNQVSTADEDLKQAQQSQQAQCGRFEGVGYSNQAQTLHRTQREEAEQNVKLHMDIAEKSARAAVFFQQHPEFDEFIQLVHQGVIEV